MNITEFNTEFFSLRGKNAVVTGGNTGLGRAFSLALAKGGADVLMPSVMPDDPDFSALIASEGVRGVYMNADLTEEGVPGRIVDRCIDEFGSIDILINCAGIGLNREFREFSRKEWDPMVRINLTAAFEMAHEAALRMIARKSGKIINIASMFSFLGGQWSPAYASTKHGIVGLTKAFCDELAQYNIQVNAIAPGYYATKVTERTRTDPERNKWVMDHCPTGRWGEPADLMGTAVFLASRASDFVNGAVIPVDGGYLTR